MNTYEAMILLDNREVKNGWEALRSQVTGILTKHKAEILSAKRWDERRLAYEIKKQKRATYFLAYFKAPPTSIDALNRDLSLTEPVLRSLILQVEAVPPEAYEPEKDFSARAPDDEAEDIRPASPGRNESPAEGAEPARQRAAADGSEDSSNE